MLTKGKTNHRLDDFEEYITIDEDSTEKIS